MGRRITRTYTKLLSGYAWHSPGLRPPLFPLFVPLSACEQNNRETSKLFDACAFELWIYKKFSQALAGVRLCRAASPPAEPRIATTLGVLAEHRLATGSNARWPSIAAEKPVCILSGPETRLLIWTMRTVGGARRGFRLSTVSCMRQRRVQRSPISPL